MHLIQIQLVRSQNIGINPTSSLSSAARMAGPKPIMATAAVYPGRRVLRLVTAADDSRRRRVVSYKAGDVRSKPTGP